MGIKNQFGRLLIFGGIGLAGYQAYLWYVQGSWTSFPLSILAVEMVHYLGCLISNMPAATDESIYMLETFHHSDFPFYLRRFLEVIPLSAFMLFMGNLFWKWEKILGPGLRS